MEFTTMTNSQLVAAYNEMATAQGRDPVTRFSTAEAGRKRCAELQALMVDDLSILRREPTATPAKQRAPKKTKPVAKKAKGRVKGTKNHHPSGIITKLVDGNPKRPGSRQFDLWKLYRNGMTVEEFRATAGDDATYRLYHDVRRNLIRISSK